MSADAAFWNSVARKYARSPISDVKAYEETLTRVRHYLGREDHVLELGCGTGSIALKLADGVDSYTATDASSEMIAIAREKFVAETIQGLTFKVSDADAIQSQQYDVILGFNLLHLVPDPDETVRHVHAALPNGGLFISKTPCLGNRWYLRPLIWAMQLVGKAPGKVHLIAVEEFDAMITRAGFEIVESGLYPPSTPSRFLVARKA